MLGRVSQWEGHTWELEFASGLLIGENPFLPCLGCRYQLSEPWPAQLSAGAPGPHVMDSCDTCCVMGT